MKLGSIGRWLLVSFGVCAGVLGRASGGARLRCEVLLSQETLGAVSESVREELLSDGRRRGEVFLALVRFEEGALRTENRHIRARWSQIRGEILALQTSGYAVVSVDTRPESLPDHVEEWPEEKRIEAARVMLRARIQSLGAPYERIYFGTGFGLRQDSSRTLVVEYRAGARGSGGRSLWYEDELPREILGFSIVYRMIGPLGGG